MVQDILFVIDLQNDVCDGIYRREELLAQVNERIALYRKVERPILFIQHNDPWLEKGSSEWQLVEGLDAREVDLYMDKTHANGFYHTPLQELLIDLQVESIEFCGAQTEFCVNSTLVFAHGLGYRNFMQHGATSTFDNQQMTAQTTIDFYEQHLWEHRFLEFIN
ncbi:cysteine hydrolase family protein [Lactococcus allomyrinae]|uniref:Cysteine hydrolase n=1 Tax=Lactococcus allomyrinae TaxID=2419773 RepID=A0A387BRJ0_9LACT|nr:cysteine hydrolase family protein [Lactococcus allomyrinae]AYG01081.1 cysteine hydrolase [Lactococcus allomyrinae]